MNTTLIKARGLSQRFGEKLALDSTDLSLRSGEFLTLLGPSGCGKTTLLKLLSGLLSPSSGEIEFSGVSAAHVFQRPILLPWRTATDNVLLPVQMHGQVTAADKERAQELLELVGLGGFEKHHPNELSGGMQQRVALARALMEKPQVLFLDEPFSALDEILREELNLELMRLFQHEPYLEAAVMVTHSVEEAAFLSDRVAVLGKGPGRIIDTVTTRIQLVVATP